MLRVSRDAHPRDVDDHQHLQPHESDPQRDLTKRLQLAPKDISVASERKPLAGTHFGSPNSNGK